MADVFVDSVDKRTTADELVADIIEALSSGVDSIADYELTVPQILTGALMQVRPGVIKNTKLILIPRATSSYIGPVAVYYNRIHSSEIFPLRVLKGSAINTEELIPEINQQYKLRITADDIINEPLPEADVNGYVTVNMQMQPTSLIFYGSDDIDVSDPGQLSGESRPATTLGDSINYTVVIPNEVTLERGDIINIVPHVKSTGSPTLRVNNFPTIDVKQYNNLGEKVPAVFIPDALVTLYYDGEHWIVTNPIPATPVTPPAKVMRSTTTAGTSSVFTVNIDGLPAITAGIKVPVTFHTSSTSASTIIVNNNPAAPIKQYNADGTLSNASIVVNQTTDLYYDGVNWIILGNGVSGIDILPSIAQLRMRSKTGRKTYMLTGYYAPGDNGGGLFYLDETDNITPDNGGTVVVTMDGGRFKRVEKANLSLEHFGAKPDGTTDCTSYIMKAMQSGMLDINGRNNTYLVTTLNLYNNVTIRDINLVSRTSSEDYSAVLNIDGTLYPKSNIMISNVTIDGNRAEHRSITDTFEAGGRHGIRVRGRVHDLYIVNTDVVNCASDGLYFYSENTIYPAFTKILVENCTFNGNRRHGISTDSATDVKIRVTEANNNGLDLNTTDEATKGTRGVKVGDTLIGRGAYIWSSGLDKQIDNIRFDQCDMLGNANGGLRVFPGDIGFSDPLYRRFNRVNIDGGNYEAGLASNGGNYAIEFGTPGLAVNSHSSMNVVLDNVFINKGLMVKDVRVGYIDVTVDNKHNGYHAEIINSRDITLNIYTQEILVTNEVDSSIIRFEALDKINTVSTLRMQADIARAAYQVLGHTEPGDGGGGIYVYDPGDTTSQDNNGTVIVRAENNTRWRLLHKGVVSLKHFGVFGTGEDEWIRIQRAIDSGVDIEVDAGTYLLSDTLKLTKDNQRFIGKDTKNVIFKNTLNNKNILQIGNTTSTTGKNGNNVVTGGFTLVGNSNTYRGLKVINEVDDAGSQTPTGVKIQNIAIKDVGTGHALDIGSPETTVRDVEITDCYKGLRIGPRLQNSLVESVRFNNVAKEAFTSTAVDNKVLNNTYRNISIVGCSDNTVTALNLSAGINQIFDNLYLSNNKSINDITVSLNAYGNTFRNITHNLTNTVENKVVVLINDAQNTRIDSFIHLTGTVKNLVKITGTSPRTSISTMHILSGTVEKNILDESNDRLTTVLDNRNNTVSNLIASNTTGKNALSLVDSTNGQVKAFFRDGGFYMAATTAGAWVNAIDKEVYMNYGSSLLSNLTVGQLRLGTKTGPIVLVGTGSPEGSEVANIGSMYLRTDGETPFSLYSKTSGNGLNTGWSNFGSIQKETFVIQGGVPVNKGAQIVLGMGDNKATNITTQGNNTWNIKSDSEDDFVIYSVDNTGTIKEGISVNKTTGKVTLAYGGTVPTAATGSNTTDISNTAYVKQEIDAFASRTGVGAGATPITDIDDLTLPSGYHGVIVGTTGTKPVADPNGTGLLQVVRKDGSLSIRQLYFDDTGTGIWTRIHSSGVWSAWIAVGEIGGVNDHQHDEYALATHTHTSFESVTFSGDLKFTGTTATFTLPTGNTAQRPATPVVGMLRYNSETMSFEGYNNAEWGAIGGSGSGSIEDMFYENSQTLENSYTLATGRNASTTGPVVIADGKVVTVSDGARLVIL